MDGRPRLPQAGAPARGPHGEEGEQHREDDALLGRAALRRAARHGAPGLARRVPDRGSNFRQKSVMFIFDSLYTV